MYADESYDLMCIHFLKMHLFCVKKIWVFYGFPKYEHKAPGAKGSVVALLSKQGNNNRLTASSACSLRLDKCM